MSSLESLARQLATDADYRAAFAADPDAMLAASGLTLDDAELSALNYLHPLLSLPAGSLLQQLLGDNRDPWLWAVTPPSAPDEPNRG